MSELEIREEKNALVQEVPHSNHVIVTDPKKRSKCHQFRINKVNLFCTFEDPDGGGGGLRGTTISDQGASLMATVHADFITTGKLTVGNRRLNDSQ